jgi:hypothetical protein
MSGTNQFQAIALGGGANVLTPAAYAALASLIANGYQSGTASSQQVNTTLRQATFVANAIAQIIANNGVNALDDGNSATFVTNLLAAIAAQGVTAARFDNSTKNATTAFVQRALGNYQTNQVISSAVTLTAADCGTSFSMNSAAAITLPLGSTVAIGSAISVVSTIPGAVVSRQGADTINLGGSVTAVALGAGDSLEVVWSGGQWVAIQGTTLLKASSLFANLLSGNGYQKLPSGLILQWGSLAGSAAGDTAATFAITFPTACVLALLTGNGGSGSGSVFGTLGGVTASGLTGGAWTSGGRTNYTLGYLAIGF